MQELSNRTIAIIELASHFEVVRSYANMILHYKYNVCIYTRRANYDQLTQFINHDDRVSYIVDTDDLAYDRFLASNLATLNKALFVIVTSPQDIHANFIKKIWTAPSFLVVHDALNYYHILKNIVWFRSLTQPFRILKYLLINYYPRLLKAKSSFDAVIVPSPLIKNYLIKHKLTSDKVFVLPFLWNEFIGKSKQEDEVCKIVIPGSVSSRSRDYDAAALFFMKHMDALNKKIELVLCGKVQDKSILEKFQKIKHKTFQLTFFLDYLDQASYDLHLTTAHFLYLPLNSDWEYGIVSEKGGQTCLSGNIGDLVRYAVPAFLPTPYPLQSSLLPFVTHGEDDLDLIAYINEQYYLEKQKIVNHALPNLNKELYDNFQVILNSVV